MGYSIVHNAISSQDETGSCYLDHKKNVAPPSPPSPPAPSPGPVRGGVIRWTANDQKCIDLSNGELSNGNTIEVWTCNTVGANQNWFYSEGSIRSGRDQSKCIDMGDMKQGTKLQIWDCNGQPQQLVNYDYHTSTYRS